MTELAERLRKLADNLWWSWNHDLDRVFRIIDEELWRKVHHNPVAFLADVSPEKLEARQNDANILAAAIRAESRLSSYTQNEDTWAARYAAGLSAFPVAYFSPEFCIHESLPIYSGGLGVLAGDHLKSCSDLGLQVYGVSLLYRQGYFTQEIDADGRQHEHYHELQTDRVPVQQVVDAKGKPLVVEVPIGEYAMLCKVWKCEVGRCVLVLLDITDSPIRIGGRTDSTIPLRLRLYGGNKHTRILQELALGVGGYRALRAMGIKPSVLHLNEGHAGFCALESIAELMENTGLPFDEASKIVANSVAFTTHTPVAAGHDYFAPTMVLENLSFLQQRLKLTDKQFLGLGRANPEDDNEEFCMTILGLKLSRRANGVSTLHGHVSRKMWSHLWPHKEEHEVPIGHITNGAHVPTWIAMELQQLYNDCLGSDWIEHLSYPRRWRGIDNLDEIELWQTKLALKRRLLDFVARKGRRQAERVGKKATPKKLRGDVLTIGFARRFATYKRGLLFFEDMDRAKRMLTNRERPVQMIFAGKAHPADEPGKEVLHRLIEISNDPDLYDHVVVLENHDRSVSRHMLEGCDVWLNNPRRPLEACGTSGMKAIFNATLNCATLDGWWDEAYDGRNGFAIGEGCIHVDSAVQDKRDAIDLMDVLEHQVIPQFYDRNGDELPLGWLRMVKHALTTLAWRYNSDRMVMDYVKHCYLPCANADTSHMP
ncbi:MAG: alpha-glucan family phosphorylase [Myxococcales bacterium]|nr:MAG: alpha-glucan family phosphorylase [Myxococcales bacterium]